MSNSPTSHSPDLRKLQDEGYEIEIRGGLLLVHHVPYVNSSKEVAYGILASKLELANDRTVKPRDHVAQFIGGIPHDTHGRPLSILHQQAAHDMGHGLTASCSFSSKPAAGYRDYHHKMSAYAKILESEALQIDPGATARTFRVIEAAEDDSPFLYRDTATERAGVTALSEVFKGQKIVIVGLGGTGSHILDLVAKTWVAEIHLYDRDRILQHNPFRSPGATSAAELEGAPNKANFHAARQGVMRRGVHPHPEHVTETNVEGLADADFVFICIDSSEARGMLAENLERMGRSFIDVGMGVSLRDGKVGGLLRVTTSTPEYRNHERLPTGEDDPDEIYSTNAQIAELNLINAGLAVMKWKKLLGFYPDSELEHHSVYAIDGNTIVNDDLLP